MIQNSTASCAEYLSYLVIVEHHDVGCRLSTLAPGQSVANVPQEAVPESLDVDDSQQEQ